MKLKRFGYPNESQPKNRNEEVSQLQQDNLEQITFPEDSQSSAPYV